jgi:hypothetical protein
MKIRRTKRIRMRRRSGIRLKKDLNLVAERLFPYILSHSKYVIINNEESSSFMTWVLWHVNIWWRMWMGIGHFDSSLSLYTLKCATIIKLAGKSMFLFGYTCPCACACPSPIGIFNFCCPV